MAQNEYFSANMASPELAAHGKHGVLVVVSTKVQLEHLCGAGALPTPTLQWDGGALARVMDHLGARRTPSRGVSGSA